MSWGVVKVSDPVAVRYCNADYSVRHLIETTEHAQILKRPPYRRGLIGTNRATALHRYNCTFSHAQYILWATDPDRGFFSFARGKKIKRRTYLLAVVGKFGLFSRDFDDFLTENLPSL